MITRVILVLWIWLSCMVISGCIVAFVSYKIARKEYRKLLEELYKEAER